MKLFNIGDRIVSIKNGNLHSGVVKRVFDELVDPILAVEFDDGTVEKVLARDVATEPKTETPEKEPVEKSEITITPDKFREIACRVVAEECIDHIMVGVAFTAILGKIHKALFIDSEN